MPPRLAAPTLHDLAPDETHFLEEVLAGLREPQKRIPCKYFYDARGSELFEQICRLEAYYPTRTELAIMQAHAGEMATLLGPGCLLIEFGSGSSRKTRLLLDRLEDPAGYVPVDISLEMLQRSAAALAADYRGLEVIPVRADYTHRFELPSVVRPVKRRAVYFPGSTIGNFPPREAREFLAEIAALVGDGGALLIGVDLRKSVAMLELAYDDPEGVTAAFNRNLLSRINRELGADFREDRFVHRALWNQTQGRVEMHLVSREPQSVRVGGERFSFAAGETIHTENSYKYRVEEFRALAAAGGFDLRRVWSDPERLFSVQYLTVR